MKRLLTVILLFSTPVFATTNQIDFNWGRSTPLGSVQAQGSTEQDGLRGTSWSADGLHHVSNSFYLGFGFGHFSSEDNQSSTFILNKVSTVSSKKTSSLLLGRMDFGANARFVPYAIAGLGWVQNSLTVTALPASSWDDTGTSEARTFVDQSKSTLGYAGGLGLDVLLSDRLLIGIEARYEGSPVQHFAMTSAGAAASLQTDLRTSADLFSVGIKAGVKY